MLPGFCKFDLCAICCKSSLLMTWEGLCDWLIAVPIYLALIWDRGQSYDFKIGSWAVLQLWDIAARVQSTCSVTNLKHRKLGLLCCKGVCRGGPAAANTRRAFLTLCSSRVPAFTNRGYTGWLCLGDESYLLIPAWYHPACRSLGVGCSEVSLLVLENRPSQTAKFCSQRAGGLTVQQWRGFSEGQS